MLEQPWLITDGVLVYPYTGYHIWFFPVKPPIVMSVFLLVVWSTLNNV